MANGLLSIGSSGLLAFQRTLNTIGHNIANVNTPGYSRQSVQLSSRAPQSNGFGFSGTGVDTVTITRSFNAFVEASVRNGTSATEEYKALHGLAVQLDNVTADKNTGMNASIQRFFNAMQDVANSPATPATRTVLFNAADQLAKQFNALNNYIESTRGQVNSEIKNSVTEINSFTSEIAKLNQAIVVATGRSGGQPPNDLLDQRDSLIRSISKYAAVTTVKQDDGSINVMVGKGQLLVRGSNASVLKTVIQNGDPNQLGLAIDGGNNADTPVSEQRIGGRLGGVIGFRNRMLNPTSNSLGRVAIGMGSFLNAQNSRGMNIDGGLGGNFFQISKPGVFVRQGTAGNVSVSFNDPTKLTNYDYMLTYKGSSWGLSRTDTGQAVAMTGAGTAANPFIVDGLKIQINAPAANGDSYLIRPTRTGAQDIQMVMADSRQIAAAAPVRSAATVTNTGTGVISAGVVTDINNAAFQTTAGKLTPPILVRFTSGSSYDLLDNTNPTAPVVLESGISYSSATGGEVFPTPGGLNFGYTVKLTGAPVAGDTFSTQYNTGGSGDNRNALLMAGLSTTKLLNAGTASFSGSYNAMVADVGTGTRQAELSALAQKGLLNQVVATRESVSGVNLDNEAANLVRFQQAYQASAKVIATASSLFNTLLRAVG